MSLAGNEVEVFRRQGFGSSLPVRAPAALLVVDFVNGFADPAVFGGGNIRGAIANTVPLLAAARRSGWPVAFSRIVYADDGADKNVFAMKVPGLLQLTEQHRDSDVVSELTPAHGELIVRKTVPSAFFGTALAQWLVQRAVRTVVVTGAVTSGCVRASVVDAMSWGFIPVVVADCVGDRASAPHEASLFDMEQKYAVVMKREEVLRALQETS